MRIRLLSEHGSIQSALAIPLVIAMLAAIGSIVKIYTPFSKESAAAAAIAAVQNGLGNIATSSASGVRYYIDVTGRGEERAANIAKAMSVSLPPELAACVYGVDVKSVGGNTEAITRFGVSSSPDISCPDPEEKLLGSGKQLYNSRRDKSNLPLIAFAVIQKSDSKFINGMIRVASANPSVREIQMAAAARASGGGFPGFPAGGPVGVGVPPMGPPPGGGGLPIPGGLPGGKPTGLPKGQIGLPSGGPVGLPSSGQGLPSGSDGLPSNAQSSDSAASLVNFMFNDWIASPPGSGIFVSPVDNQLRFNSLNMTLIIDSATPGQPPGTYKISSGTNSLVETGTGLTIPISDSLLAALGARPSHSNASP